MRVNPWCPKRRRRVSPEPTMESWVGSDGVECLRPLIDTISGRAIFGVVIGHEGIDAKPYQEKMLNRISCSKEAQDE